MGHPVPVRPPVQKGQFTMDNSCLEMMDSAWVMGLLYKITRRTVAKSFGGQADDADPAFKMMMVCATDCPLRSTVICSGGALSDELALGMLDMANGHFFRGLGRMLKK
jgi:hypothetical protein